MAELAVILHSEQLFLLTETDSIRYATRYTATTQVESWTRFRTMYGGVDERTEQ